MVEAIVMLVGVGYLIMAGMMYRRAYRDLPISLGQKVVASLLWPKAVYDTFRGAP